MAFYLAELALKRNIDVLFGNHETKGYICIDLSFLL